MFTDALNITKETVLKADLCIVGAGAAGITIAKEFLVTDKKVLLIESGDFEYDDETQKLYEGENISFNKFNLANTRLRYFGGSTNHWGGMCRPLDNIDFHKRDGVNDLGWPIQYADLEAYYKKAHTVCQLGEYRYDDVNFWAHQPEFKVLLDDNEQIKTAFFQFSPPTRFGFAYKELFTKSENIEVILNGNVLEIISHNDGEKISKLKVSSLNRNYFFVEASHYVVATGGMEVPRLLLLSNGVHKSGIGNQNDLVGRYYMDHLGLWGGSIQFMNPVARSAMYFNLRSKVANIPNTDLGALLTPTDNLLMKNKLPNFRCLLMPAAQFNGVDSSKILFKELSKGEIPNDIGEHLKNVLFDMDTVLNSGFKTIFNTKNDLFDSNQEVGNNVYRADIDLNMEQMPNRDSRVTLSNEKDAFGQNVIKLDWKLFEREKYFAHEVLSILAKEISKQGVGRIYIPDSIRDGEVEYGISCHHMGTTRMSDSAETGVVDRNCCVHGMDNLYIASSSVFPSCGWANPTLTIVALAIRLAEHLKNKFREA